MPHSALTALVVAVVFALAAVAYLRYVQRARFIVDEGIRSLAAMRWREFSQFVITALQAQGFDAHPLSSTGNAKEAADLLLTRDERSWLLSCRQSADYRVTERQVEEMRKAVHSRSAAGGIIATLGRVEPGARRNPQGVELIDGRTLWTLIAPLLPASLHEHVGERAEARTRRATAGALGAAVALGAVLALIAPGMDTSSTIAATPGPATAPLPVVSAPATSDPRIAAPAPQALASDAASPPRSPLPADAGTVTTAPASPPGTPAAIPSPAADGMALPSDLPASELRQRQQIIESLRSVPGITRAVWSSRSTLVLYVSEGAPNPREPICTVMRRFDTLRASRIQLQPPAGSVNQVRFFHCATY